MVRPRCTAGIDDAAAADSYGLPLTHVRNKKPPPGLDMFEMIKWKRRQREAKEAAEGSGAAAVDPQQQVGPAVCIYIYIYIFIPKFVNSKETRLLLTRLAM